MLEWKNRSQGKTALLIEGARRVGKSTIVKAFAESGYETHIIDFSMASREIRELFDDVSDLNYLFLQLQLQFGVRLVERRSLISIRRNTADILIPSEEEKLQMRPMDVKRGIISLYEEDFYKLSPSGAPSKLFDAIPSQLANKSSRYRVSSVIPTLRAATVQDELSELVESKTVLMARHVNNPNVGMSATVDIAKFKLYLADTGLFVTLAFKDEEFTDNVIYRQLLADKLPVNLGMVYENVVAQELAARGHGLFYHAWAKRARTGTMR